MDWSSVLGFSDSPGSKMVYFGDSDVGVGDVGCSTAVLRLGDDGLRKMGSSSSATAPTPLSVKKGSGAGAAKDRQAAPTCKVDGCSSDLQGCREYHRRHRVCEEHSKSPVVEVGGQPQRFCQQCSRFQSLMEFDELKRSCRRRLDGHNKRRRKPQNKPWLIPTDSSLQNTVLPSSAADRFFSMVQMTDDLRHTTRQDPPFSITFETSRSARQFALMPDSKGGAFNGTPVSNDRHSNIIVTQAAESECARSLLSLQNPNAVDQQRQLFSKQQSEFVRLGHLFAPHGAPYMPGDGQSVDGVVQLVDSHEPVSNPFAPGLEELYHLRCAAASSDWE